jgi:hypothetical protein
VVASSYLGKILVDWDSTVNDFDGFLLQTLNDRFGSAYVLGDMKTWDFLREMDPEHVQHTWGESVYHNREWTLAIPPLPGAILGMNRLRDAGYYLRIVTARTGKHLEWVQEWLTNQGVRGIEVTCADSKDKAKWAERWGYNIAIEDAPHHVLALADVCERVYMVEKPYNSHVNGKRIERVPSLWVATERILDRGGSVAEVGRRGSSRKSNRNDNTSLVDQRTNPADSIAAATS